MQNEDVEVAAGRVCNGRIDHNLEIRQVVLVRREHDGHVPLRERRMDVWARERMLYMSIRPGRRRRGLLPRLKPLLQLRDPRLFRLQGR